MEAPGHLCSMTVPETDMAGSLFTVDNVLALMQGPVVMAAQGDQIAEACFSPVCPMVNVVAFHPASLGTAPGTCSRRHAGKA